MRFRNKSPWVRFNRFSGDLQELMVLFFYGSVEIILFKEYVIEFEFSLICYTKTNLIFECEVR